MRSWIIAGVAAGLALAASGAVAGPPAELRPTQVAGPGLYVADLEAQKAWYMDKLGMSVTNTMKRDDKPFEYIMGFGAGAGAAILALAKSGQRPAGRLTSHVFRATTRLCLASRCVLDRPSDHRAIPSADGFPSPDA